MRAEDIKVGMWARWGDDAVRVTARLGDLVQVDAGQHGLHIVRPSWVEPWTPRVGEWVRWVDDPKPRRVVSVGSGYVEVTGGAGDVNACEPCLPPAPPTTHMRADGVESPIVRELSAGVEAATETARKQVASWSSNIGANSTCLHCGGLAYLGLQEARCLAPKCERVEPEPEVRELWVGFRHEKRPGERGIRDALLAPMGPEYERWWQATGRGVTKNHPIREEAIRLWREAVFRGFEEWITREGE